MTPIKAIRLAGALSLLSITSCRHAPTAEAKSPTATPVSNEPLRPEALMDQAAADAMLANLEKSEATLRGPAPEPVFERLEKDHHRLNAVLAWFKVHDHPKGLRAVSLLPSYWTMSGHIPEGRAWVETFLAFPENEGTSIPRAKALVALGYLAFRQGDTAAAKPALDEALAEANALGDKVTAADALVGLGRVALREENLDRVYQVAQQAKKLYTEAGDRNQLSLPTHLMAEATRMRGRYPEAAKLYRESLQLATEQGNRKVIAVENSNLAAVAIHDRNWEEANRFNRESLRVCWEIKNSYLLPYEFMVAGEIAAGRGDYSRAAKLLGAADSLFKSTGAAIDPADKNGFDAALADTKKNHDPKKFDADWAEGSALPVEKAVALALEK